MLISSLVKNQIVAALITFAVAALFIGVGIMLMTNTGEGAGLMFGPQLEPGSLVARFSRYFSVPLHFHSDFTRGVLDTRNFVLYVTTTLFCLFLTVRSLEARRLG
jgi:ABC-2 type transport system permease protein